MKLLISTLCAILLFGCQSTSPLPKGFQGATASLDDSFSHLSHHSGHFFVASKIDGKPMVNSAEFSESSSFNQGHLVVRGISRPLEAGKNYQLTLIGRTAHSAPIVGVFADSFYVSGDVSFTPKANEFYTVVGTLGEDNSQIWIEDLHGNRVTDVIDKSGKSTRTLTEPAAPAPAKDKKALFTTIRGGESTAQVIKKLGEPASIDVNEANIFSNRQTKVIYHYPELGLIQFEATKSKKNWYANSVIKVEVALQGKEDIAKLSNDLDGMGAAEIRDMARAFAQQSEVSNELLDSFTQKVWDERNTTDAQMIDAVAWLCTVVGNSGNLRYEQALNEIATDTQSPKLKKYAVKAKSKLTKVGMGFELQR
ncbi:hypothetical protein [Shewanella cyperi]|uniref:hypothetical protein n=1 Tax=Shewanella cyperi TaxID=2814292 RepID=UPI001A94F54D|nr:hypothetical protein [Shewanella cyperi]QSX41181.1 hypothetical protein JYB84_01755 [Shewanella cyperi]